MSNLASLLVLIRPTRSLESKNTNISLGNTNRLFQAYFVYISDRQATSYHKIENNICTKSSQTRLEAWETVLNKPSII
ncbi:unnamed protein product [Schistosoma mansoni]|uniref:Smp_205520 n=1 Tax=Schistosoma mansoni TaxID=6183 RepID=UPI00022C84B6|nr:unnamed protein product [Schistosoma mansoni]|eukprot:XP_018647441.1 unnamed protein product [Schistosoma mansoni]